MNYYGQNLEDKFIFEYFAGYIGNLLDIGANRGEYLSNSKLLIDNHWSGSLYEPGETFKDLCNLHNGNERVKCYNLGVGDKNEYVDFWESSEHIPGGSDTGLVSTTNFEETKRWPNVKFEKKTIQLIPFSDVLQDAPFDFITLDAESMDWIILKQIDLKQVGCKCLCIEHNSNPELKELFSLYCYSFGLTLALENAENLIFVK